MKQKRRLQETEFARSLIVRAAEPIFVQKGYHGATLDEIARAAGYSPAAIYTYFRNKGEVLAALLEQLSSQFASFFDAPQQLPFAERLGWVLARALGHTQQHRKFLNFYVTQRSCIELELFAELHEMALSSYRRDLSLLSRLMTEGIDEGAIRPGDPDEYAVVLSALVHAFVFRWLIAAAPGELPAQARKIIEIFLHGCKPGPVRAADGQERPA